jgi:peroxiredoxin Q/BCP
MGLFVSESAGKLDLLKIGKKSPNFCLPSSLGGNWELSSFLGKVIVLLFYPQNETLICTRQLCSVRDNWADYLDSKALVVGISPGILEIHQEFAKRYHLPCCFWLIMGGK